MIDFGGTQHVFELGWVRITVANLVVLGLMALVITAPGGRRVEPDAEPLADDPDGGWTGSTRRWARRELPLSVRGRG